MGTVQPSLHYKYMQHLVFCTVCSYLYSLFVRQHSWVYMDQLEWLLVRLKIHVPPIQCVLKHCGVDIMCAHDKTILGLARHSWGVKKSFQSLSHTSPNKDIVQKCDVLLAMVVTCR